jgi:hypothetical protein
MLHHSLRSRINGTISTVDDISNYTYNNVSFSLATNNARGSCIDNTGTRIYYTTSEASNYLRTLVMSTAYSLSTASLSTSFTSPANPQGISINATGTQFHITNDTSDRIDYGTASTAYNISTLGTLSNLSVSGQTTSPQGHSLGDSGTKMYVYSNGNQTIYQYTLGTAYSMATASYASISFTDATRFTGSLRTITFNLTGTKMYCIPTNTTIILQYNLSTAWNISTAVFAMSLDVSSTIAYAGRSILFSADMSKMYLVSSNSTTASAIQEYIKPTQPTPKYISVSTYSAVSTSTTHNVPAPTVYNAGDLIVIFIASGSDLTQALTDAGWTTVVNTYNATADNTMHVAYRTAGSEPSTYGVTQSSARGLVAACVVLRNAAYNTYATATSASSSGLAVSVTPFDAFADGLIYYSALSIGGGAKAATPPTGYTEIAELYTGTTFSEVNLQIAYRVPDLNQATTSVTNTWATAANNQTALFDFKYA